MMMQSTTRRVAYQPGLDGLRGMAACGVFLVHWNQFARVDAHIGPFSLAQFCASGRYGVSMFLLISGYCLAAPLWDGSVSERYQRAFRGYWRRRAARILPMYWSLLLVLFSIQGGWHHREDWFDLGAHAIFIHNFWAATLYSISEPFWALAVFAQYYLFFWAAVSLLRLTVALTDRVLLVLFCSVCFVATFIGVTMDSLGVPETPEARLVWQHSLLVHLPIFASGALLAGFHSRKNTSRVTDEWTNATSLGEIMAWSCATGFLALLASPWVARFEHGAVRYGFPVITLLQLILMDAATRSTHFSKLCSMFPIRGLGVVSLGIYLVHLPVLKLCRRISLGWGDWGGDHAPFVWGSVAFLGSCMLSAGYVLFVDGRLRRA